MTAFIAHLLPGQDGRVGCVREFSESDPLPDGASLVSNWPEVGGRSRASDELWLVGAALEWRDSRELSQVRAEHWAMIKAERDRRNSMPISAAGGYEIDGDDKSRMNLLGAIMDMQLTGATSRWWVCADNVRRELTAAQIREVGLALAARTQALVDAADALRAQVFDPALTEAEQIEAINWPPDAAAIP